MIRLDRLVEEHRASLAALVQGARRTRAKGGLPDIPDPQHFVGNREDYRRLFREAVPQGWNLSDARLQKQAQWTPEYIARFSPSYVKGAKDYEILFVDVLRTPSHDPRRQRQNWSDGNDAAAIGRLYDARTNRPVPSWEGYPFGAVFVRSQDKKAGGRRISGHRTHRAWVGHSVAEVLQRALDEVMRPTSRGQHSPVRFPYGEDPWDLRRAAESARR